MGLTSGLIGLGGAAAGLFGGGGAGNVQLPPQFNMPNMGGAASNAFSGIQNLGQYTNLASSSMPFAQNTFQNLYNNPYAGGFQGAAGQAAGMGQNAAVGAYGGGANLMGAGQNLLPGAQQIMNTAFDPQQALYNRTLAQTTDQTRAGLETRGLATTPYGAGVEAGALNNFNIDWQNQQLQRQALGANAAGGLVGAGGNAINMGAGIMNQAPGQYLQASAYPYSTFSQIGGGQNQALQNYLGFGQQAQGIANAPVTDYLSYLQTGNSANQVANQQAQLALNQQQQQFQQNMLYGQMLGGSMYGIGRANQGNSPFASWAGGQMFG